MVTYQLSIEHNNYPNLTVYDTLADGVLAGWRVDANEGYAFYDTNDETFELDKDGNETPINYCSTVCYFPKILDWDTFGLIAVPHSAVDENGIYNEAANKQ